MTNFTYTYTLTMSFECVNYEICREQTEEAKPNEECGVKKKKIKANQVLEALQARFLQKELPRISSDEVLDFHVRLKKRQMIQEIRSAYQSKEKEG